MMREFLAKYLGLQYFLQKLIDKDTRIQHVMSTLERIDEKIDGKIDGKIDAALAALATIKQTLTAIESGLSRPDEPDEPEEAKAFASTRPSWPRMKKFLEERDVRGMLPKMNSEADQVEQYWKTKQGV